MEKYILYPTTWGTYKCRIENILYIVILYKFLLNLKSWNANHGYPSNQPRATQMLIAEPLKQENIVVIEVI